MKKIIFGFIFTITLLVADSDWPFICEPNNLSWLSNNRYYYIPTGGYNDAPAVYIDTKSIQIDKKKKIIKVWTIWLISPIGHQNINETIIGNSYRNIGYYQSLFTIDYKSRKRLTLSSTDYNCDGSTITTHSSSSNWKDILPDSVMEGITDSIIEKYNLK